jgi:hypothetical protein
MKKVSTKKKTTLAQQAQMNYLVNLSELCKKNHIFELKLPDGTQLTLHQLAFYQENNEIQSENNQKPDQSDNNQLEMGVSLGETLDEDLLYMSARS